MFNLDDLINEYNFVSKENLENLLKEYENSYNAGRNAEIFRRYYFLKEPSFKLAKDFKTNTSRIIRVIHRVIQVIRHINCSKSGKP